MTRNDNWYLQTLQSGGNTRFFGGIQSKTRSGKANIYLIAGISVVLLIFVTSFGIAAAAVGLRDGTGDLNYLNEQGTMICPSGSLSVVAKSTAAINRINKNLDFYKEIAAMTNVPWQMIAAIHYREANSDTTGTKSYSNGKEMCNKNDYSYPKGCNNITDDARGAMEELQGKVSNRLTQSTTDPELIKKAFFGFNGGIKSYGTPDNSPYVMNNYDETHTKMPIVTVDGSSVKDGIDTKDGAFTLTSLLFNANFDSSGKITSLQGCSLSSNSTMGPELAGDYYPPLGALTSRERNFNGSAHTVQAGGHGVFEFSNATSGYTDVLDGALDINVSSGSRTPIYASFSGTIKRAITNYQSHGSWRGGILYLVGDDGASGAIYAHIGFSPGITENTKVSKGQKIGYIAPHCNGKDGNTNQCVSFNSSDHLHFQIYINKKAQTKDQIIKMFYK